MREALIELDSLRCPRCAGQLVLRVLADERGRSLLLTLDSACVACGTSPWSETDQRTVVFTPGATIAAALGGVDPGAALAEAGIDLSVKLAAAQSRIDSLLRRAEALEGDLAAARRNLARATADERRRIGERDAELRGEITRLEGSLAEARAEVRRAEEATRGVVSEGKRAIEIE